jgi:hypothetical protein
MTNITYSPGPWYAEDEPYDSYYQISCNLYTVAQVEAWDGDKDEEVMSEAKANARLIAAAPELLLALEGALYALDGNIDGSGPSKRQAIVSARAAIAKAIAAGTCTADDGGLPASMSTRFTASGSSTTATASIVNKSPTARRNSGAWTATCPAKGSTVSATSIRASTPRRSIPASPAAPTAAGPESRNL